ncbi:hypothetical protein [Bacillus cereus]|uniref:hypothetical protein n=1 Tax=Bacillus cereus TaxID=1396 RepID=UPI003D018584
MSEKEKKELYKKIISNVTMEMIKEFQRVIMENFKRIIFSTYILIFLAFVTYIAISILYLVGIKKSLLVLRDMPGIVDWFRVLLAFGITVFWSIPCFKLTHTFYRLKKNKNTTLLYGAFEYLLGIITLVAAGLNFIDSTSEAPIVIAGVELKTYFAFYGGMYVMVRGLENAHKYFKEDEHAVVFFMKISEETYISKFLIEKLKDK